MTSKRFFYTTLTAFVLLAGFIALVNSQLNGYGLFRDCHGESLPTYYGERTSKYLLAHNYIPSNFDGVIVGPSLSDNLDPSALAPHRVYNASINGGNASELRLIVEALVKSDPPRFMVLCLSPYLTKTHGRKSGQMVPEEVWGALGSVGLLKSYASRFMVENAGRAIVNDASGFHDYNQQNDHKTPAEILAFINDPEHQPKDNVIHPDGYADLSEIIRLAHQYNIRLFAYYHPYPYQRMLVEGDFHQQFKQRIAKVFSPGDVVLDFGGGAFENFNKDLANHYIDQAHLSHKGTQVILKEIRRQLDLAFGESTTKP